MRSRRYLCAARAACASALALALAPAPAAATPSLPYTRTVAAQSVAVEVTQASPSVTPDGTLRANVVVTLTAPADYLEVRLRLRGRTGTLLYQKTEVRSGLPSGRHVVSYEYDLGKLKLARGRYPVEVRVLATGAAPTTARSRLLVVDKGAPAVPVALMVRASAAPATDAVGRFARDPATDSRLRDDLAFLTQLALARRRPIAIAVAPVLVDQIARAAAGYETTAGVVVSAGSETSARYAQALAKLRDALASGAVTLLDVPYALPDLAGLASAGRSGDLARHWSRGDAALAAALHSQAASATAYLGSSVTPEALATLGVRGTQALIVPAGTVRSGDATAQPGSYSLSETTATVVVADDAVAAAVSSGADAFYDALFDRIGTKEPVLVALDVGPSGPHRSIDAQHVLDWVAAVPWLESVPVGQAADRGTPRPGTLATPRPERAPERWPALVDVCRLADAYAQAAGAEDADARRVLDATLLAESTLWEAGAGGQGPAEAESLASYARDFVQGEFSRVSIDAKDVTLSGRRGEVPLTLVNQTSKPLNLTLVASADRLRVRRPETRVVARPDENFVTVPVDLAAIITDELRVAVRSGDVTVAETRLLVRASYLDRFATLGMVIAFLVGLLVFIRRRVRSAIPGTIADDGGPGS